MKLLITILFTLLSTAVVAQVTRTGKSLSDDIIFYESFDKIKGKGGNDGKFTPGDVITQGNESLFDNSTGVSYDRIMKGYKCIYIGMKSTYHYTTPGLVADSEGKAVLSFRLLATKNYLPSENLTVSCIGGGTLEQSDFDAAEERWIDYWTVINGMTSDTKLKFRCSYCFIDEIKVSVVPSNLDEVKDNMIYITLNAGQTRDVELIRTLTPNIWCPLCLPFDVTQEMMGLATNTICELCTLSSVDDGVFIFEEATSVSAGTPFLVKVATSVVNPTFTDVIIRNTPAATATASTDDYKFVGTYSPIDLETDGSNLFLATDGKLYTPESAPNNRLGGLRAYFVVPPTANTARVMIPETTSNISGSREVSPSECYELFDLRGQRTNNPNAKGLYIHGGKKVLIP